MKKVRGNTQHRMDQRQATIKANRDAEIDELMIAEYEANFLDKEGKPQS